jgi:hypothetical protein
MKLVVMRHASTMEDEGRDELIGTAGSWREADVMICKEVVEGDGYYTHGQYYILKVPDEATGS